MADIAAIFGWSPAVMDPMDIEELMDWHERAGKRIALRNPFAAGEDEG